MKSNRTIQKSETLEEPKLNRNGWGSPLAKEKETPSYVNHNHNETT